MKDNRHLLGITFLLLWGIWGATGCTFSLIKPPPDKVITIESFHGRFITALGEDDDWALEQTPELSRCSQFTMHYLVNGKISLETCHGRFLTAPSHGNIRVDWAVRQEARPGDCGQFDLYEVGKVKRNNDEEGYVAIKTCAGKFFTAGDGNWGNEDPGLEWSIVAETDNMEAWEVFILHKP